MSNIAIVEEVAQNLGVPVRFKVIGWTDPKPHYVTRDTIEMVALRMKDFMPVTGKIARAAKGCDLMIDIGGGDSFTDIYGLHRFGTLLGAKILTLMGGVPLILAPQTIGPFDKFWSRGPARAVMNRARAVVTRDAISTGFARDMKLKTPLIEATDVAMRLPYDAPVAGQADGPLKVGINVSGLLMNGGYTQSNQFGLKADYPTLVRAIITDLQARDGVQIHLVGHVLADDIPVEDDHRANLKLAEEFDGLVVAPSFATPSEAKTYIADLDVFMGARMHACIAAFSSGVPVLPMAYSRKFKGVFGTLGYDRLADCQSEDADVIRAKVADLLDNHEAIGQEVRDAFAKARARLEPYEALIRDILAAKAAS